MADFAANSAAVSKDRAQPNPFRALAAHGQSVWLDYIRGDLIASGELARLVDEGLTGVTSNPAIFEKAITGSGDYWEGLVPLARQGFGTRAIYERLAIADIQAAADVLRSVYDASAAREGYVSLEISPHLARDARGTVAEARRLWREADRPNVMIKVPGTPEGLPALRELLAAGINVNVTLLFAAGTYAKVADAYVAALEDRIARGLDVSGVASVASFFVSRLDTAVDMLIGKRAASSANPSEQPGLAALLGKAAVANAKLAYQHYVAFTCGPRWQSVVARGAHPQRLLWASTGTKNPDYSDLLYVEELIGPDTVNTMPPATLEAFRDHGRVRASLTEDVAAAHETLVALKDIGIALTELTDRLLDEGVVLFEQAFDGLLAAIETEVRRAA